MKDTKIMPGHITNSVTIPTKLTQDEQPNDINVLVDNFHHATPTDISLEPQGSVKSVYINSYYLHVYDFSQVRR